MLVEVKDKKKNLNSEFTTNIHGPNQLIKSIIPSQSEVCKTCVIALFCSNSNKRIFQLPFDIFPITLVSSCNCHRPYTFECQCWIVFSCKVVSDQEQLIMYSLHMHQHVDYVKSHEELQSMPITV